MAIKEGLITPRLAFIQIKTKKMNKTLQSMVRFNKETEKIAKKTFNKMLLEVKREIKKAAPKITGALRKSIRILENKKRVKTDFVGIVGPDGSAKNKFGEEYAPFVTFGTRLIRSNNYMERGFKNAKPAIKKLIKDMGRDIKAAIRRSKT